MRQNRFLVHVALLLELDKTSDLFKLSHNLVDLFPEWSVAWYAVGALYQFKGLSEATGQAIFVLLAE